MVQALPAYAYGASDEKESDPYGQTMTAFRASLRKLLERVERVVERLGQAGGDRVSFGGSSPVSASGRGRSGSLLVSWGHR
jgi:hypothetical protein